MTEPSSARPIPGPPRPGPAPAADSPARPGPAPAVDATAPADERSEGFEDLEQRPVAEHVGVFEAEHARLQRELGTIDQL
jgi:hypothetical protein